MPASFKRPAAIAAAAISTAALAFIVTSPALTQQAPPAAGNIPSTAPLTYVSGAHITIEPVSAVPNNGPVPAPPTPPRFPVRVDYDNSLDMTGYGSFVMTNEDQILSAWKESDFSVHLLFEVARDGRILRCYKAFREIEELKETHQPLCDAMVANARFFYSPPFYLPAESGPTPRLLAKVKLEKVRNVTHGNRLVRKNEGVPMTLYLNSDNECYARGKKGKDYPEGLTRDDQKSICSSVRRAIAANRGKGDNGVRLEDASQIDRSPGQPPSTLPSPKARWEAIVRTTLERLSPNKAGPRIIAEHNALFARPFLGPYPHNQARFDALPEAQKLQGPLQPVWQEPNVDVYIKIYREQNEQLRDNVINADLEATRVMLGVTPNGRVARCEPVKSGGNVTLDDKRCYHAKRYLSFRGVPAQPTDEYLRYLTFDLDQFGYRDR